MACVSLQRQSIHQVFLLLVNMAVPLLTMSSAQSYIAGSLFLLPTIRGYTYAVKSRPPFLTGRISIQPQQLHPLSVHFRTQPKKRWIQTLSMVLKDPASEASLSQYDLQMQQAMRTNTHMSRQTLHSQQNNINVEPLVICGPSGVGKGTIIEGLMKRYHNHDNGDDSKRQNPFGFSVSHTTRQPRPGEEHGKHYYFMEMYEMQQQIEEGKFVEYAHVHGNLYGTSKQAITDLQQNNKITILDIDRQGVMAVKQSLIPAKYVFIAPPSMEELEGRLRGRGTETEEAIQRRLGNAAKEIEYGHAAGNFDHVIVNNDIDGAIQQLANILEEWYPQLQKKEQD